MQTVTIMLEGAEKYHTIHAVVQAREIDNPNSQWFTILTGMFSDCRAFVKNCREDDDRYEYRVLKAD